MPGTVIRQHRYTRASAERDPRTLYLFGDNLRGGGRKGQAVIRGLPNAVGVPTKRRPDDEPASFLTDADLDEVAPRILAAFLRADEHLRHGGDVVIPADGLGTGLAQLPSRAPEVLAYIETRIRELEDRYGTRRG